MKSINMAIEPYAYVPERAHIYDAGIDIKTPIAFTLGAGESRTIDTGVRVEIPNGYVGILMSKSGLNINYGITSEGVIDSGYDGCICVKLYNHSHNDYIFDAGDKITQLLVFPVETPRIELVESIIGGERGDHGFGSTGR